MEQNNIRDLGIIGDRRTCALITRNGNITWYCPRRFDKAANFSSLIDQKKGGYWSFGFSGKKYIHRSYEERGAVLTTEFAGLKVDDFMPLKKQSTGICRIFSEAPETIENDIFVKPYYGLGLPEYEIDKKENTAAISRTTFLAASHPLFIQNGHLKFIIPKGESGWAFLSDRKFEDQMSTGYLKFLKEHTLEGWKKIASKVHYEGIFEKQVNDSLRAIQLMTFGENGGIIAAATTSLPEVPGGFRNYDYRYVWLRDSAMITSALIRAESNGEEERKFLSFLCDAKVRNSQKNLLPFYSLDKLVAQPEEYIPLEGFQGSQPVRIGNDAMDQLQLDANANVLLAAKMIYNKFEHKDHWDTIVAIADFLVERWEDKAWDLGGKNSGTFHFQ